MQRVCFLLKVKADRLEEYRRRHEQVWPEMLEALRETGWRNYSLFLREDGLLTFRDGHVTFDNYQGLVALTAFDPAYLDQAGPLLK